MECPYFVGATTNCATYAWTAWQDVALEIAPVATKQSKHPLPEFHLGPLYPSCRIRLKIIHFQNPLVSSLVESTFFFVANHVLTKKL